MEPPNPSINDLIHRVTALEKYCAEEAASFEQLIGAQVLGFTKVQALEIVVVEMAIHLGIPAATVKARLEGLQKNLYDQHLQKAERMNSGFAARIDNRDLNDVPTEQEVDPLFPPMT
jgi:hypothetical protein